MSRVIVSGKGKGACRNEGSDWKYKGQLTADGYVAVSLYDLISKKYYSEILHRLVCFTFKKYTYSAHRCVVDHIDRKRSNNNISNLRWVLFRENTEAALGVEVLMIEHGTGEETEYPSLTRCAEAHPEYEHLSRRLKKHMEVVMKNHSFYRLKEISIRKMKSESFYI
jgi:hypothetical protein